VTGRTHTKRAQSVIVPEKLILAPSTERIEEPSAAPHGTPSPVERPAATPFAACEN
jgi:hypothetical protein